MVVILVKGLALASTEERWPEDAEPENDPDYCRQHQEKDGLGRILPVRRANLEDQQVHGSFDG